MASNPINLALRFVLELAAWAASGVWGWHQGTGALRVVLALGIPLVEMVLWGTFRVPEDASSSGRASVPVFLQILSAGPDPRGARTGWHAQAALCLAGEAGCLIAG
jgi:hypothetical protein